MKKQLTLIVGAIIVIAIMALAAGSVQAQRVVAIVLLPAAPDISGAFANTATQSQAQTEEAPTATAVPTPNGTPSAVIAFLPDPPEPEKLPTDLSSDILYQEPPEDCAVKNDPQESCSTRPGQVTDADFTLPANTALVMTGDVISISQDKKELAKRPNKASGHDLHVVINTSSNDVKLHMLAPHGSYRGYFSVEIGETWTMDEIAHLRNLHLERFLLPPQPREYTPTPVANAVKGTNVRVVLWDGTQWKVDSGYYWLKDPYWQRAAS